MIITDELRQELVGKNLICIGDNTSLTDGKSYKVIKSKFYESNKSKTLVTVLNDLKKECDYALDWFINEQKDEILYDKYHEYKLSELLKFEEGTKFKDVNSKNILQISGGTNKHISVIKENKLVPVIFCERWLNTTYIKLKDDSISFDEVCDILNTNHVAEFMLKFRDNNFNGTFNKILETLSKYSSSYKALQKGEWYLKEKNKVEYVDFMTAKEYMETNINNKTKYKDYIYHIKDNQIYKEYDDVYRALTLEAINSKEWILI